MIYLLFLLLFLLLWAVFYAAAPALRHVSMLAAKRLTRATFRSESLQRIAAHTGRFRDYFPVALVVLAGGVLAAWCGDLFLDLAELVRSESAVLRDIDHRIHRWAISHRSAGATRFFATVSAAGGPWGLAILVGAVVALLVARGRHRWAAYVAITSIGGGAINMELKRFFARARPELAEMLRETHGYSFPSGHSMGATVVFGALSYVAFRALESWPARSASLALAVTFVVAVALSRVYLGAHWISDVAAGVTAGLIWFSVTTVAYETVRRIRMLRVVR